MSQSAHRSDGMARAGVVPAGLGRTLRSRRTPWVAIGFTTLLALGLVATGDLADLADTTVMLLLVVFTIVNVVVLVLRADRTDHPHFTAPKAVPVLGAGTCLVLLTQQYASVYVRGVALLLVGLGLWAVNWLVSRPRDPN